MNSKLSMIMTQGVTLYKMTLTDLSMRLWILLLLKRFKNALLSTTPKDNFVLLQLRHIGMTAACDQPIPSCDDEITTVLMKDDNEVTNALPN